MSVPRFSHVYPVIRLLASLLLMAVAGSAMYAAILVLEPAAAEFDTGRGAGSMPYTLFMLGFALGGVMMGRLSDRFGIVVPALLASLCLPAGLLFAARAAELWHFSVSLGVLCGLFGMAGTFAPVASDISHWFTARRGFAVGIVISGTYVAGMVWPPVLQHFIDTYGWRATFHGLGNLTLLTMLPLSLVLYRPAVVDHEDGVATTRHGSTRTPLGFSSRSLQGLLCLAGVGCCAAMAMPQVHIVPLVIDLGFEAVDGARMLAVMLGCGVVSRLVSGWISDRIGGLKALLVGSALQGLVIFGFLFADGLSTLYMLAIAFGLSQGGIVPSYTIIIRYLFPAGEAGWRIGTTMLFTVSGMALGGWLAGALYDLTGNYTASILVAFGFNVLNFGIAAWLIVRDRVPPAGEAILRPT
ncbi:MAG: MFS transporter [Gammaproteobacteria bacterium]|nr:MFS transporter [Gammaproteobacteria bacterium]